jgi:hypothetical protein
MDAMKAYGGRRGIGPSLVKPWTKHGKKRPFYQITDEKETASVKVDT